MYRSQQKKIDLGVRNMEGKAKKISKKVMLYLILIILVLIWIVPIFTLVATSIKSKADFYTGISLFSLPETIFLMRSQREIYFGI